MPFTTLSLNLGFLPQPRAAMEGREKKVLVLRELVALLSHKTSAGLHHWAHAG